MQDDYRDYLADDPEPNRRRYWWLIPALIFGLLFWAGVFCLVSAAIAGDTYEWDDNTRVRIQDTAQPGARAEVVFLNNELHSLPSETFDLTHGDLTVTVTITPDRVYGQPDTITVTPPPGYLAIPETLVVPENGAGVIYLFQDGMM